MAIHIGALIIATTCTSKKRGILLNAGANYVIATEEENLVARVMSITNGQGADMVYEPVTFALSEQLLQATKIHRHWIVSKMAMALVSTTFIEHNYHGFENQSNIVCNRPLSLVV
ncbi:hypothetical protein NIES4071_51610 [Calothrix sp. NIES-4071]|nr:hypothetical protein NIES4071_51610 [Calothrix sp. NIES-4071]BAZ59469.1 hypothetical protein NIES4105_51560 [Calothrix sp. NIES-4105]